MKIQKSEKNKKEHCYWNWPSVGSDESGTGGLFGGAVYVAVRITNKTTIEIEKKLKNIYSNKTEKDPKNWDNKKLELAVNLIYKTISEEDICIWRMKINKWNDICKKYKNKNELKKYDEKWIINCIGHDLIHWKLTNDYTLHVVDNFLIKEDYELWSIIQNETKHAMTIHAWQKTGEENWLSINIAAILATYENRRYFNNLMKDLNLDLTMKNNHFYQTKGRGKNKKIKDLEDLRKIEISLKELNKNNRNFISIYCKHNLLEKVEKYTEDFEIKKIIGEVLRS